MPIADATATTTSRMRSRRRPCARVTAMRRSRIRGSIGPVPGPCRASAGSTAALAARRASRIRLVRRSAGSRRPRRGAASCRSATASSTVGGLVRRYRPRARPATGRRAASGATPAGSAGASGSTTATSAAGSTTAISGSGSGGGAGRRRGASGAARRRVAPVPAGGPRRRRRWSRGSSVTIASPAPRSSAKPTKCSSGWSDHAGRVGDPALHLEHERADVGRRRPGLGLDEVRVLLATRPRHRCAGPSGPRSSMSRPALSPGRVAEHRARRSRRRAGARGASGRSRRSAPRTRRARRRSTANVAPTTTSCGPSAERAVPEREVVDRPVDRRARRRGGRRRAPSCSTSRVSWPCPPAFIRTAPPTVPGMPT